MPQCMLRVETISKSYGGFAALAGCSMDVNAGTITGIIGPNGAGKSTLFNIVGGVQAASGGEILLEGRRIGRLSPHERARAGLVRTFQISRELGQLTVLENMLLASANASGDAIWRNFVSPRRVRREQEAATARARGLLEQVDLWRMADEPARNLSGGQKKLLEISRALMLQPKIMLLDEPTAGVSPAMCRIVVDTISHLRATGITFAIIEHDMDFIARLCDPIFVLAEGRTLTSGTFAQVTANQDVMRAYLGRLN